MTKETFERAFVPLALGTTVCAAVAVAGGLGPITVGIGQIGTGIGVLAVAILQLVYRMKKG